MERVKIRAQTFEKAFESLQLPLKKISLAHDTEDYKIVRDSLIKRFEYTFETFWQLLKQMLEDLHDVKTIGTRDIFRESLRMQLITEKELVILLDMVLDRNQTAHAYKEIIAQEIANDIPEYFKTMKTIFERLQKNL